MEQKCHKFHLGTINVRTCRCESKLADCVTHCKQLGHVITCMQEVRQSGEGEICFDDDILKGWHLVCNGMKKAQAGVAVALAPHVKLLDTQHIIEGRLTIVRVKVHGVKLAIYSCYCPTEEYATGTKETFYRKLNSAIHEMKKRHSSFKIIVASDFNATIGHDCEPQNWKSIGLHRDENPTSFNGTKLIETAEENSLFILNTMFATRTDEH